MDCEIDGITLHYSDTGNGVTLVACMGPRWTTTSCTAR